MCAQAIRPIRTGAFSLTLAPRAHLIRVQEMAPRPLVQSTGRRMWIFNVDVAEHALEDGCRQVTSLLRTQRGCPALTDHGIFGLLE